MRFECTRLSSFLNPSQPPSTKTILLTIQLILGKSLIPASSASPKSDPRPSPLTHVESGHPCGVQLSRIYLATPHGVLVRKPFIATQKTLARNLKAVYSPAWTRLVNIGAPVFGGTGVLFVNHPLRLWGPPSHGLSSSSPVGYDSIRKQYCMEGNSMP